jgi:indole-3-glycerol phosphate synthase
MIIYEVGSITAVKESNGSRILHGFNVIGINGRPLVTFNYDTEEEAAAAREQMREAVARARTIITLQGVARLLDGPMPQ